MVDNNLLSNTVAGSDKNIHVLSKVRNKQIPFVNSLFCYGQGMSVMMPELGNQDAIQFNFIDDPMFIVDTPRPVA